MSQESYVAFFVVVLIIGDVSVGVLVFICGLPLGGVVKDSSSSCVGHMSEVSIGGSSPYLFMSTVLYLSSPTFFS